MTRFVPFLAEEAIERDAVALLAEFSLARNVVLKPPIPVEDIVEKHLKLRIEFDDMHERHDVPRPSNGESDILGAIYGDGSIFIDESLDPEENPMQEGRYRFTLAHEGGGHWRLHQHLFMQDVAQTSFLDGKGDPKFLCRSSQAKAREEWQADFYASCLLMPRSMVFEAWRKRFGDSRPRILRNNSRFNVDEIDDLDMRSAVEMAVRNRDDQALQNFVRPFAARFLVSPIAMRIRLEKLGLLHREIPRQKRLAGVD